MFDFIINTYDKKKHPCKNAEESDINIESDNVGQSDAHQDGASSDDSHLDYLPGSGHQLKTQVVRQGQHETLPDFIGGWFPNRKISAERELYAACVLVFFKPWHLLSDILEPNQVFEQTLDDFVLANPFLVSIMENIDYYHDCLENAKNKPPPWATVTEADLALQKSGCDPQACNDEELEWDSLEVTEMDIEHAQILHVDQNKRYFAEWSMDHTHTVGCFGTIAQNIVFQPPSCTAKREEMMKFEEWHQQLTELIKTDVPISHPPPMNFNSNPAASSQPGNDSRSGTQPLRNLLNAAQR